MYAYNERRLRTHPPRSMSKLSCQSEVSTRQYVFPLEYLKLSLALLSAHNHTQRGVYKQRAIYKWPEKGH